MNKFFQFLKSPNLFKRFLLGLVIGIMAFHLWTAIYAAVVAASSFEAHNKLRGAIWRWPEWIATVAGGLVAATLFLIHIVVI